MGKRQRRRQREQRNALTQAKQAVPRYFWPDPAQPLLEVHLEEGMPDEDKALCLAYWEFAEPGTWNYKVAELGSSNRVLQKIKENCHASLATLLCPQCTEPITVKTRSELAATRRWHADLFPAEAEQHNTPCQTCHEVAAQAREQAAERAQEQRRRDTQEKLTNATAWLAAQEERPGPEDVPTVEDMLVLLTMIDVMERTDSESFGPLREIDYLLTASDHTDVEAVKNLHRLRWITPTTPASTENFAFNENNTVRGVYVDQVPWRLAPAALGEETVQARRDMAESLRHALVAYLSDLKSTVQELDAVTAVQYLDQLLMRKYSEEPVPEHRLQEAYDTFRDALHSGFTLGQLLAIAWSSTASSVAWGQRTPGLRPGSVSSASVTNLGRRLGYASDRPVPEYTLPNWVTPPATRATLLRLLSQHGAEGEALERFRSLRQCVEARDVEDVQLDGDLEDATRTGEASYSSHDFLAKLNAEPPPRREDPPITYVMVHTDGTWEVATHSPQHMRERMLLASPGVVDRVLTNTVHAYVGEATRANANLVANEMLQLLGCYDGPFSGPTTFFAASPRGYAPSSLDEEQLDMLRAAHQVAQAREAAAAD